MKACPSRQTHSTPSTRIRHLSELGANPAEEAFKQATQGGGSVLPLPRKLDLSSSCSSLNSKAPDASSGPCNRVGSDAILGVEGREIVARRSMTICCAAAGATPRFRPAATRNRPSHSGVDQCNRVNTNPNFLTQPVGTLHERHLLRNSRSPAGLAPRRR
jgi:hypothetical protein